MTRLVADAVVRRLRDWGVHRMFGYAGDGIDPLLAALRRAGGDPEYIGARHEEGAALMASGHAKFTGEVGCCIATHGPGAIHLLNGLYDAKLDGKPVVAVVGQQHRSALGSTYQQEIDTGTLYKDVCGAYAATVLAAGERVALLVGQGAGGAAPEVREVAERLGAGVATSLLGKPVIDESLPYVCGCIGHLGTDAAQRLMDGCDTLLMVGTNDPWTEFYPAPGQARAVQVDIDGRHVGMRYPTEVNLVGDAAETLRGLLSRLPDRSAAPARDGWRAAVE